MLPFRSCKGGSLFVLLVVSIGYGGGRVRAQEDLPIEFTNLVDDSGPFQRFSLPHISRVNGAVAFSAVLDSGTAGIFTIFGGELITNAVDTGSPIASFVMTNQFNPSNPAYASLNRSGASVNSAGTVVFPAYLTNGTLAVFASRGGPLIPLIDNTGKYTQFISTNVTSLWPGAVINDSGTVAVIGHLADGNAELLSISRTGAATVVARTSAAFPDFDLPAINTSGRIAWVGTLPSGFHSLLTGQPGDPLVTTLFSGLLPPADSWQIGIPAFTDRGGAAFFGIHDKGDTGGYYTIRPGAAPVAIVSSTTPGFKPVLGGVDLIGMNSAGRVAFLSGPSANGRAIFTGPAAEDRLIGTGDTLFGSTVDAVALSRGCIDEFGRVVFSYALRDGRRGIAVSSPPPPRAPTGDLLVKLAEEDSSAWKSEGVYLSSPSGAQSRIVTLPSGTNSVSTFQVRFRNNAAEPVAYLLRAIATGDEGWKERAKIGNQDQWTTLSGDGYSTGLIAPGAGFDFEIQLSGEDPKAPLPNGTRHKVTLTAAKESDPYLIHDSIAVESKTAEGLVVNSTGDEEDADSSDGVADVDLKKPGHQVTLRAAIQFANDQAGALQIQFDLPKGPDVPEGPTIFLKRPLPPVKGQCDIVGRTQPGGGWVQVDGRRWETPGFAMELRGKTRVNGLAFVGFSKGAALHLSGGVNTVEGCRFGVDASGSPAETNAVAILVTADSQTIGVPLRDGGNLFVGGAAGILVSPVGGQPGPRNVSVVANEFGRDGANGSTWRGPSVGLVLTNAAGCHIGGTEPAARNVFLVSLSGVVIEGSGAADNVIAGNWFGLASDGKLMAGDDRQRYGVVLARGAHHNRVGVGTSAGRNLIAGAQIAGVLMSLKAHDNLVRGNWVGVAADGIHEAHNHRGVWLVAGSNNRIGGAAVGQRNIISGNLRDGVLIGRGSGDSFAVGADPGEEPCIGSVVEGNWIGVDPSGSFPLPNARDWNDGAGVRIERFATGTMIGGVTEGRRNLIGGNNGPGILTQLSAGTTNFILGNLIGTSIGGEFPRPNKGPGLQVDGEAGVIIGGYELGQPNRIAFNTGAGVDLSNLWRGQGIALGANYIFGNKESANIALSSTPTPNDPLDGDIGPNGRQNWPMPVVALQSQGVTVAVVELSSFASRIPTRVDIFRAFKSGGGDQWLGGIQLVTRDNPKDLYAIALPLQSVGTTLTALATTPDGTSEYSPSFQVREGLDSDGDGVPDPMENGLDVVASAGPGLSRQGDLLPSRGDRNGDGIPDAEQRNVVSVLLPLTQQWVTLEASTNRGVGYPFGLQPREVAALPSASDQIWPGAIRFHLDDATGEPEPITLWTTMPTAPITIWASANGPWQLVSTVAIARRGALASVRFTLPPNPATNTWILALGRGRPEGPAPGLFLGAPAWVGLGPPPGEPAPEFDLEPPVSSPTSFGWMTPIEISKPVGSANWLLEQSADLIHWAPIERSSDPHEPTFRFGLPLRDQPAAFFRWKGD